MNTFGIDIGDYKTVIYSSRNRGKIVYDEMYKRKIPTELQLSVPRKYGNRVDSYNTQLVRRAFRDELDESLAMFIGYLKGIVQHDVISFAVPFYYSQHDRARLRQLCEAANVRPEMVVTDVVAIAAGYAIGNEKFHNSKADHYFIIIDFGHSKTTAGLFHYDRRLTPLKIKGIRKGARDFDKKILEILLRSVVSDESNPEEVVEVVSNYLQAGLNTDVKGSVLSQTLGKINKKINYVKTILNSTEAVHTSIDVMDENVNLCISKEDFLKAIEGDLNEIRDFLIEIKREFIIERQENPASIDLKEENSREESLKDPIEEVEKNNDPSQSGEFNNLPIEICGGNSAHFIIKSLMNEIFPNYGTSLNVDETCALGTALSGACNSLSAKINISVKDRLGGDTFVKIDGGKPVKVFKKDSPVPTDSNINLKYKRKSPFKLQFLTNENSEDLSLISELEIKKDEKLEDVNISIRYDPLGMLDVRSVYAEDKIDFSHKHVGFSDEEIDAIRQKENEFLEKEMEIKKISEMRTGTEEMLMGLKERVGMFRKPLKDAVNTPDSNEPKIENDNTNNQEANASNDEYLDENDIETISSVIDEYSYLPLSKTLAEEKSRRSEILDKLADVNQKIGNIFLTKKVNFENNIVHRIKKFIANNNTYTPSIYKLKGILYRSENIMKSKYDFMNIQDYYSMFDVSELMRDILYYEEKALKEIEEKKKEEELKREEQLKKKDELKKDEKNSSFKENEQDENNKRDKEEDHYKNEENGNIKKDEQQENNQRKDDQNEEDDENPIPIEEEN